MVVVDASVVVAALVDSEVVGAWAETVLASGPLGAPHLMPVEVASVLRRAAIAGDVSNESAALAYADLLALSVQLFPYGPMAARVWELRASVSAYDAWYVALAESLAVPLATLDKRLRSAHGPRCTFLSPPA